MILQVGAIGVGTGAKKTAGFRDVGGQHSATIEPRSAENSAATRLLRGSRTVCIRTPREEKDDPGDFRPRREDRATISMPVSSRCFAAPMPERSSNCGELIEPPQRMTSRRACTACSRPSRTYSTPVARVSRAGFASRARAAGWSDSRRRRAGCRNASAALHRRPRFCVT